MVREMTINIQNRLRDILSHKTKIFVAKRLKCSRATVYRTLNGETIPNYELGKAIEELYKEVVENQKAS